MPKTGATIGIDIGGTKTLVVLLDEKFRPVKEGKMKTRADGDEKQFTSRLTNELEDLKKAAKERNLRIDAVGAGCAGRVDLNHQSISISPNIPFIKNYPIGEKVSRIVPAPFYAVNDVQAGLVGEHAFGAAQGCRNAIGLFIGTGIGGGIIIEDRLYAGTTGTAGDIGRYITDALGPLSGSEQSGVLEHIASRTAIAGDAAVLAAKNWAPHLNKRVGADVKEITSGELFRSIRDGDKKVEDLVRSRSRMIGIVLANLANFLAPDIVVLGGGLVEAMPRIVTREVETAMRPYLNEGIVKSVKVKSTRLKGHAVAVGAAKLAFDNRPR